MKKFLAYIGIIVLCASVPSLSFAQSSAAEGDIALLQQQIQQLLQQIANLQAQLNQIKSGTVTALRAQEPVSPSPVFSSHLFTKTLSRGTRNDEVKKLQVLLSSYKEFYPEALVTGYFGPSTEAAVKRFQKSYGLEQVGVVGPKTRTLLDNLVGRIVEEQRRAEVSSPAELEDGQGVLSPPPGETVTYTPPTGHESQEPYFKYSWRTDETLTGEVAYPRPAPTPVVVVGGTETITVDTSAAVRLAQTYSIALANTELSWDDATAGMMLEMARRLPKPSRSWKVVLTDSALSNDIEAVSAPTETSPGTIRISKSAFQFSNPQLQPRAEGNSGRVFYSNRLFRVVLRAFYNDRATLEQILKSRYGVVAGVAEPQDEFQQFTLDELQFVITVLEDLPDGFRKTPGLEKIVRRRNGLVNPWSPQAPAIAWVTLGYIEFMDTAFISGSEEYIRRLIAHEMTHFLWHHVLTEETKQQFMKLSGWSQSSASGLVRPDRSKSNDHPMGNVALAGTELWYRKTTTNFVSDYSAAHNPDEDFAETISYYIYRPDWVRTVSPDKYAFVKDVVDGYEYVILVDKQFTFQVFNLEPDVTFPGKIIGTDIEVWKTDAGHNHVHATIHLSPDSGDGAERALARVFSPSDTYVDTYFYPLDNNKHTLRAEFDIDVTAAKGYWLPDQITVMDRVDNRRYEGQKQFGWLLFIDNSNEDLKAPVPDTSGITSETIFNNGEYTLRVYVPVTDENERGIGGYATVQHIESNQSQYDYADYDAATKRLVFEFAIRKYHARGTWEFRSLATFDAAENWQWHDLKEKALAFSLDTANPDYAKPSLDVSAIRIQAIPRNPVAPNGETDVTIWYGAKDDNSGLGTVSYILLKPTGDILFDYHYHDNFYTPYFDGDATASKTYEMKLTLPPGSPPGTWVLQEIVLKDKAGNALTTNFVHIGILQPFEVK